MNWTERPAPRNYDEVKKTHCALSRGTPQVAEVLLENSAGSAVRRYGIAAFLVSVAFVLTLFLQHLFPYPFLFLFFGAVMASAWFGGTSAGILAVLVSTVLVAYFFVPPFYSWAINATAEAYFVAFVACALVASWVSSVMKKSEEALRETRDQLEIRVSERTAALMRTQAELAHLSRVLSMGELTASIAHEISQPLTAVVTHGHASLEWLSASPPNLEKVRQTTERIIQDGTRVGAVLGRMRALFKKEAPAKAWVDMNEVIQELTVFVRDQAISRAISIRTDLAPTLPKVKADRVQLQQVVLNLILNGMDAISGTTGTKKELVIRSSREGETGIVIAIEDCGTGLDAVTMEKIFNPFFTTKPHGIGLGLSISRSIIESHEGRLWAVPRPSGGAIFQFSLPVHPEESDA